MLVKTDQLEAIGSLLPPDMANRLPQVSAEELEPLLNNPVSRWKFAQRGLRVHGVETLGQYVLELARYRLSDAVYQDPLSETGDDGLRGSEIGGGLLAPPSADLSKAADSIFGGGRAQGHS